MPYAPHQKLIAPARNSPELWRLGAGIMLTVSLFLVLSVLYGRLCETYLPGSAWGEDGRGLENADTQWGALANLYAFGLLIVSVWAALILLHRRSLAGLIGPRLLAFRQFRQVLAMLLLLSAIVAFLPTPPALTPAPQIGVMDWLVLLPLALLGLILQTGAEELIFRGYLQSQLAARFSHPAVWMGVPSLLFAALHHAPGEMGANAWMVVLWAGLFGLAAADLTARSGTLGPAIALHLVNNFTALLLAAPEGMFDGLALYTYPFALDDVAIMRAWMPVDLLVLLCSWLAARVALRV